MRNLSGNEIREEFLRFFEGKGHRRVHSASLVPVNDPTLLFTNAGMNQFKDVFLGAETRGYTRAASSQKCVRAGGKHNDLENVGFTRRHHTFFEMLGNFSFGDYFKKDAIAFAWELLTSEEWFAIDTARLYVTIFEGSEAVARDTEAEELWIAAGVPKERIFTMPAADNFWQMGETGPCGPCSEIFYDLGLAASETGEDKPFPQDDQRYVEIWNLVFMQFDRSADGVLTPLPKPSIDTGMGLERIAAVLQGKLSNYESDLFTPLLAAAMRLVRPEKLGPDLISSKEERTKIIPDKESHFRVDIFASNQKTDRDHPLGLEEAVAKASGPGLEQFKDLARYLDSRLGLASEHFPVIGMYDGIFEPSLLTRFDGLVEFRFVQAAAALRGLLAQENGEARPQESVLTWQHDNAGPHTRLVIKLGDTSPSKALRSVQLLGLHGATAEPTPDGYWLHLLHMTEQPTEEYIDGLIERVGSDNAVITKGRGIFVESRDYDHILQAAAQWPDASLWLREAGSRNSGTGSEAEEVTSTAGEPGSASLRIIADHARAATFLISDGVLPANEARGYVLRKILRRGIRHGRLLGQEKPFMHEMVLAVRDEMSAAYPELVESAERVAKVVLAEELQFARTLELGLRNMTEEVLGSGKLAFGLYETFGMPLDFMVDAARDAGIDFDMEGFEAAKEEEQQRARASWKGGSQKTAAPVYRELTKTEFEGYGTLRVDGARVIALVKDGVGVSALQPGESGEVVCDATSFYADSGGQVGDVGWLYAADHRTLVAEVTGCKKPVQGVFAHQVVAKKEIAVGDAVDTAVNGEVRAAVMRNHTGTHLLHAALRQVLGTHVKQAGSLNDPKRLRFDFSHFAGVAEEELAEVESIVNAQVLANTPVQTFVDVPIDTAIHEYGAMALFGEKYGERVRVVKIGDFSTELCGGTHIAATGEIGLVKLTAESAVASGTRRVEAVTGTGALGLFRRDAEVTRAASSFVGTGEVSAETLKARVAGMDEELKKLKRELEALRMKSASAATADAATSAVEVKGVKVLAQRVDALDKSQMRNLVDELRGKLGTGVVVLGAAAEAKVSLIVGVSKDLTGRLQAGKIVGALAAKVGGKGGGRPDLAEAGGSDVGGLDAALAAAVDVVGGMLG